MLCQSCGALAQAVSHLEPQVAGQEREFQGAILAESAESMEIVQRGASGYGAYRGSNRRLPCKSGTDGVLARLRRKSGLRGWQNQARQGHEVDGTGRRWRSSAGSSARKCLSGRSYACGSHAHRGQSPSPQRPAATEAETGDRRPYL
jgi:hypothetical protein